MEMGKTMCFPIQPEQRAASAVSLMLGLSCVLLLEFRDIGPCAKAPSLAFSLMCYFSTRGEDPIGRSIGKSSNIPFSIRIRKRDF